MHFLHVHAFLGLPPIILVTLLTEGCRPMTLVNFVVLLPSTTTFFETGVSVFITLVTCLVDGLVSISVIVIVPLSGTKIKMTKM